MYGRICWVMEAEMLAQKPSRSAMHRIGWSSAAVIWRHFATNDVADNTIMRRVKTAANPMSVSLTHSSQEPNRKPTPAPKAMNASQSSQQ